MKWIKQFKLFKESVEIPEVKTKNSVYKSNKLVHEICTSMVLLNNTFLDRILDLGQKARYSENSHVFINDLKNLISGHTRLKLGRFQDNICVEDKDISKINSVFDSLNFNIEDDWNQLVNSRITARNIIDKLLPGNKLNESGIKRIYWLGINKDSEHQEDIVIEMEDGEQYSFFLNKNLSTSKSASFNTFADELIGTDIEKLFSDEYISKWNKLTQEWIKILYQNTNKNIQVHIEKFIDIDRIDSIGYFEYFDIKHRDPRFKHLGELITEFGKNILYLSDLLSEVWKNREICFLDSERVYKEWMERKVFILNSKILEHLLTESLTKNNIDNIKKLEDGMKLADGPVKMKLIKTLVEKLGAMERTIYYLGNNGNIFYQVPSRKFFRENYDEFTAKFDYHVKMIVDGEEENNDFKIKIILEFKHEILIECDVLVKFTGGEMSGKLGAKYKFNLPSDFNYKISKITEE